MAYSLWSRGRLLGASELMDATDFARSRIGSFMPTPLCEELLPVLTGVRRRATELAQTALALPLDVLLAGERDFARVEVAVRATDAYGELLRARAALNELELELRAAGGHVVATDAIEVVDALSVSSDTLVGGSRLYDTRGASSDEFPLYHIVVTLRRPRGRAKAAGRQAQRPDEEAHRTRVG